MPRKITPKQKKYAESITLGISKDRSAIMAGTDSANAKRFEASAMVQAEISRIRAEVIKNTGITREEVVAMFMEAAGFARILGDSMGLIAAAREIGKMLGHYAPEVKKTLHGVDGASLKKALKDMNDDELYKLVGSRTIEGQSVRHVSDSEGTNLLLQKPRDVQDVCEVGPTDTDSGGQGGSPQAGENPEAGTEENST